MDPRNSLAEDTVFQFELLTYNATYHTEAAVEKFLQNTFMKSPGKAPGTTMTFAHIFWAIGAEEGREVSPFHLAARVYQEQGQGTSSLISGTYPGYEGYYNYFNVGATGTTTTDVIVNGLKYAKAKNWNNAYYSILGGADTISANYIKKGQDTLYLQKFNVNPNASNPLYTHQYMQNISAPTSEGKSIKRLYASADSLDNSFVFKIPVYKNMPASASPYPSATSELLLEVPSGYDTTVWVDGAAYTSTASGSKRLVKLTDSKAKSAVVYRYDSNGLPAGMYVWTLAYKDGSYTATAQPQLEDLLSYHGFSIRISGSPGLRVKTGIASEVKDALTGTGISGYTLKEYGTLITDKTDLTTYPLVKGGKGVVTGVSYQKDKQGQIQDSVYETVDGIQRFTSVLVGISGSRYNTEFSFRGYLVLEKNGAETVVYGPIVSKSMSALATQVLNSGTYEQGSQEDAYLRQLLEDAR
jgi:beta-N-acetylglucosaminidase